VEPRVEEEKAKIAEPQEIVNKVVHVLTASRDFEGLKVLVTAGSTVEQIDPVRVITNRSSGKMGIAISEEALERGAEVTIVYGIGYAAAPSEANVIRVESTDQMRTSVISELKSRRYDCLIAAAAAADWTPEKSYSSKISTHEQKQLVLKLKPTSKIIDEVKKVSPRTFLVAFKAEFKLPKNKLIDCGYRRLVESDADLIVVNDVGKEGAGFNVETNEVFIVDREKHVVHVPLARKENVARDILSAVRRKIKAK
jgi:phosphopantothenoylcysteine decarboxylase/phosphopantothenate--cysteine ligase